MRTIGGGGGGVVIHGCDVEATFVGGGVARVYDDGVVEVEA